MSGATKEGRPSGVSAGPMSGASSGGALSAISDSSTLTADSQAASPLAYALGYAAKGWPVFPVHVPTDGVCDCMDGAACEHPGKHPWTARGLKDATTAATQIRAWWDRWPDANIGIATGPAHLVVLDVDARHHGADTLAEMIADHGPLPLTPQAITGGGGQHFLFVNPNGHPVKSRNGIAPGLDIKSDGGYIVAAPSLHVSKRRYEWEHSCHPATVPLAPAPDWLVTLANGPATHATAPENTGGTIPQGERNTVLTSMAGSMRRTGFSEAAILAALMETNRERCDPPLADAEVCTVAKSIGRKNPAPGAEAIPECVTWETMGEEIGAVVWQRTGQERNSLAHCRLLSVWLALARWHAVHRGARRGAMD
jgi:putative DNA primase/helicase